MVLLKFQFHDHFDMKRNMRSVRFMTFYSIFFICKSKYHCRIVIALCTTSLNIVFYICITPKYQVTIKLCLQAIAKNKRKTNTNILNNLAVIIFSFNPLIKIIFTASAWATALIKDFVNITKNYKIYSGSCHRQRSYMSSTTITMCMSTDNVCDET